MVGKRSQTSANSRTPLRPFAKQLSSLRELRRHVRKLPQLGSWLILLACIGGCGGEGKTVDRTDSTQAFAAAVAASESGDAATVISSVDTAIAGGLNPDQYEQALNLRAQAHARSGNLDAAMADIEILKQGAADMANVYRTMSYVAQKKGNAAAAKKAFSMAKRLNPRLKPIRD